MEKPKEPRDSHDVELPQSVIESFACFLVPEIRKFYASEEGKKSLQQWIKTKNQLK